MLGLDTIIIIHGVLLPTDKTLSSRIYIEWNHKQCVIVSFLHDLRLLCYGRLFKLLTYCISLTIKQEKSMTRLTMVAETRTT
jgi:hypothetical protein